MRLQLAALKASASERGVLGNYEMAAPGAFESDTVFGVGHHSESDSLALVRNMDSGLDQA
jgi:hypothetical protein